MPAQWGSMLQKSHRFILLEICLACHMLQVPNGVGCGLGALQLILYFIYRNNKGEAKKPALPVKSMQMGIAKLHQQKELVANGSHVADKV